MKLLIVDDSNVVRRLIQRSLHNTDFEIRCAIDGVDAIRVFQEFDPDVVTMDLTMPEADGLTCITRMTEKAPNVRILVITALADKSTAVEAVKRGAQGFLLKPFTAEQLAEKIQLVLDTSE